MNRPESLLQRAVMQYLDAALPEDAFAFAVPNGGYRRKVEAAIMKAEGVKAGVPDICVIHRGRALFMELKAPKGRLTKPQLECHIRLTEAGARPAVCRSIEDVVRYLEFQCVPLRAKEAA